MAQGPEIRGRLLAINTIWNLLGQAAPMLVGLATIPYVVRGLGAEQFGILSIAWVLLGYLSLFDLGLGRATTKFVAECLGRNEPDRLPDLVWTSLGIQIVFGIAGAVAAAAVTPFLVERILKIPPALVHDAKASFFLLAISLPIVLANNGLRGVLEAAQRFDLVNYVRVPVSVSIFVLPAIAIPFKIGLPGIVLMLVLARVVATVGILLFCFRQFPALRRGFSFNASLWRPLAAYGGWVTVSNIISPAITYVDRFFIGAMISMEAVTYYTAPYEAITRAGWVLPVSLVSTLFPAFSSLEASAAQGRLANYFVRSVKMLLLVLGPVMFLVVVFAQAILRVWLGPDFAAKSALTLQILALGVFINSLALVPYNLLQGVGRPDVTAKLHLIESPLYAGLVWFLIHRLGITGAALAWTLRVTLDAVMLFVACGWLRIVSLRALTDKGFVKSVMVVGGFALGAILTLFAGTGLVIQIAVIAVLVLLFALGTWGFALDSSDKSLLASATGRLLSNVGRAK